MNSNSTGDQIQNARLTANWNPNLPVHYAVSASAMASAMIDVQACPRAKIKLQRAV
jgi:hypothetical protein